MHDKRDIARLVWEIGVLTRGDTSGGRMALARAASLHTTFEGIGESRLVRAAILGAQDAGNTQKDDQPFRSGHFDSLSLGDRLVWVAGVRRDDVLGAFHERPEAVSIGAIAHDAPEDAGEVRRALDRLWLSHGEPARAATLMNASRRSRVGSVVALLALIAFLGAMTFVVRDLMRGAEREKAYQEQAEMYSVPDEAIEPTDP